MNLSSSLVTLTEEESSLETDWPKLIVEIDKTINVSSITDDFISLFFFFVNYFNGIRVEKYRVSFSRDQAIDSCHVLRVHFHLLLD